MVVHIIFSVFDGLMRRMCLLHRLLIVNACEKIKVMFYSVPAIPFMSSKGRNSNTKGALVKTHLYDLLVDKNIFFLDVKFCYAILV